jgi:UDP-N-acetylmuramyl pentapeptide phosphotransferase/UDP-N-acetylglucosamine-1-phosphate transferase
MTRDRGTVPARQCRPGPGALSTRLVAMALFLLACAASLVITFLVIRLGRGLLARSRDVDLSGPQKFHERPVPRIGGVGIVGGLVASVSLLWWQQPLLGQTAALLLACALPAFAAGLAEDLTKDVSPARRLLFTAISAALGVWLLGAAIRYTAIPGLDWVVAFPLGAALVTVFAVSGVANAVNIIDGFNGLASMCVVLMLASMGYVGFQVGDTLVVALAAIGVGAVLGFFVWNFPLGLIFLGDGGAYFLGFYVAEVAILLISRNDEVSPMFVLLVCIYPIFETIFSIYRKKFLRKMSPGVPDGVHFHMLLYKRIMRWAVGRHGRRRSLHIRNSMTSPYLWMMCMLAVVPAVLFWDETAVLAAFIALFGLTYVVLYWRIVRFRTPRFLRVSRWSRSEADEEPPPVR